MTDTAESPAFSRAFNRALVSLGLPNWYGKEIHHYTDLAGLKGIVENHEIWLSDHRFLNDPTEHSHGLKLALRVLLHLMDQEEHQEFKRLLSSVHRKLHEESSPFYVASFSLAVDRLDQWKGYGGTDGVCLTFSNDALRSDNAVLAQLPAIEPKAVVYALTEQEERLRTVVNIYRQAFIAPDVSAIDLHAANKWLPPWDADLAYLLASQFIVFKHPEYASEEEVRLILSARSPVIANTRPEHRVSGGRIIPYMTNRSGNLRKDGGLPLIRVTVGPLAAKEVTEHSIKVFLLNHGLSQVEVVASQVPFRG